MDTLKRLDKLSETVDQMKTFEPDLQLKIRQNAEKTNGRMTWT